MSDVKWIKLTTNMFEDEKIDFIESLPEADTILVIWIKILTLAGKVNDGGRIYLTENIAYTDDMLAHKFKRPISTVKMALETLRKLEMIETLDDGKLFICNWEKHQNIEGMEKIREQNRLRKQKQRAKEKQEKLMQSNMSRDSHVTSQQSHATDIDIDIEEDIDIDNKDIIDIFVPTDDEEVKNKSANKYLNDVITNWNSLDENIPKLISLNSGTVRFNNLKARVNQYGAEAILKAIENIRESSFLKGYVTDFKITFDWFVKPNNFLKVLEGNYKDKEVTNNGTQLGNNYADNGEDLSWMDRL